jgi:hypothetical protein
MLTHNPAQVITTLYSPDVGSITLAPGTIYAVQGEVSLLNYNNTLVLAINPRTALPSARTLATPNDDQITVNSVGTVSSIDFHASLTRDGFIRLCVTVDHEIEVSNLHSF